jgi:hypothetical protein
MNFNILLFRNKNTKPHCVFPSIEKHKVINFLNWFVDKEANKIEIYRDRKCCYENCDNNQYGKKSFCLKHEKQRKNLL